MIKTVRLGFAAAQNYGKKHFATAVKATKELKAKVKIPNKSAIKASWGAFRKDKVRTTAAVGLVGTVGAGVVGHGVGKHSERKRAKAAIARFSFAQSASELGIKTPARLTSPAQRQAIIRQHNKNVDKRRSQYKKFYS
jgi:hypothetical protein